MDSIRATSNTSLPKKVTFSEAPSNQKASIPETETIERRPRGSFSFGQNPSLDRYYLNIIEGLENKATQPATADALKEQKPQY